MSERYFYREEASRVGDVIPKFLNGRWELFYLKGYQEPAPEGARHGWHHISAENLEYLGPSVPIGVLGGTGDLIEKDGVCHLFACIFPEGKQYVTHYVAEDASLNRWRLLEEDTFGPDGLIYKGPDWRDPRIVYEKETGLYHMYLCARENRDNARTGCVGHLTSRDLRTWEYLEPLYAPGRFAGALECPDVFTIGDWEYLIFSAYTGLFGTYYVKRRKGETLWQVPYNHRLDARAFYAAKTASDGEHRYLFGWNPTKEEDIFGYWPSRREEKDLRTFDWGGAMVIHEVGCDGDGNLTLKEPAQRSRVFYPGNGRQADGAEGEVIEHTACTVGDVRDTRKGPATASEEDGKRQGGMDQREQVRFLGDFGSSCRLEVTFALRELPDSGQMPCQPAATEPFGVYLRADRRLEKYYTVSIEPAACRLQFKSHLRCTEEGGKMFPYDVECETFFLPPADGIYHLTILTEGEVGVAYLNDSVALSFRMCDLQDGECALFFPGNGKVAPGMVRISGGTI